MRTCDCPHEFPICACYQHVQGNELLRRSRWLSSIAGWPAKITEEDIARVVADHPAPPRPPESARVASTPLGTVSDPKGVVFWIDPPRNVSPCGCTEQKGTSSGEVQRG